VITAERHARSLSVWAIAFAVVALAPYAFAQTMSRKSLQSVLTSAIDAYDRGVAQLRDAPDQAFQEFRQAKDGFESVIKSGVENGKLYYNLGNTYLRMSQIGKAIAAYRRAERLIPGDAQLQSNLRYARSCRRDKIRASGERTFVRTVFFLHYSLPIATRMTIALAAYAAFWVILLARLLSPKVRLVYPALLCLIVWISFGVSVAVSWPAIDHPTEGVLIAKDVMVRKGNGESYDLQFVKPLHEGVEFQVLETRNHWVHIELPDGNGGWVRRREVALF